MYTRYSSAQEMALEVIVRVILDFMDIIGSCLWLYKCNGWEECAWGMRQICFEFISISDVTLDNARVLAYMFLLFAEIFKFFYATLHMM